MKILIIRHGDPDYSIDSLTEKGWKEAEFLSEKISRLNVRDFYVSPLGRAKDTASLTLKKINRTAAECEWLREFAPRINRPDHDGPIITWDWLPQDWTSNEDFYRYDRWFLSDVMKEGKVKEEYDWVTENFDRVLARYGYVREEHYYRVEQGNNDTIVFFCHFGLGCVLLSHLLSISPMVLWHGFCAAPSSVTVLTSEERRKGIASFRMSSYGDISHLYVHDEEPAFAARFCECFENEERHD
ncbi:MAG: histidine phosphatase family protein [Candidatus Choladocola sp.]|nr:histidine phosphatase family protein [Candidatus Choladocola sp.]